MSTTISVPSDNAEATRCQHSSPSGRRCRHARKDSRSRFCAAHDLLEQQRHDGDRCDAILGEPDPRNFNTAAGINHALTGLYVLLAEDKISPRRAAVLAYISSLQLRTLPVIEHETQRDAPVPRVVFDWPQPAPQTPDSKSGSASEFVTPVEVVVPLEVVTPTNVVPSVEVVKPVEVVPVKAAMPLRTEVPRPDRSVPQVTETILALHPTPRPAARPTEPRDTSDAWPPNNNRNSAASNILSTRRPSSTPAPAPSGAPTANPPIRPSSPSLLRSYNRGALP